MDLSPYIDRFSYKIKKQIGNGSFGSVFLAEDSKDGSLYALKKISQSYMKSREDYRRQVHELNILFFNRCPYLLHGLDIQYNRTGYSLEILTEYYKGGSLDNFIYRYRAMGKMISNEVIWRIFLQIAMGIEYLHMNGVIHRDLKPANILIDHGEYPLRVAICDFGASICLGKNTPYCKTKIGTPYFMSPEQYNSNTYDKKTDVWSLGCILYELITTEKPFVAPNIVMLNYKISKGAYKPLLVNGHNREYDVWAELLKLMIQKDSRLRIDIVSLLRHPIVREKLDEFNIHRPRRCFYEIPYPLQNRVIFNSIQMVKYIENIKLEIGDKALKNISLTSSLRTEYRPSPFKDKIEATRPSSLVPLRISKTPPKKPFPLKLRDAVVKCRDDNNKKNNV